MRRQHDVDVLVHGEDVPGEESTMQAIIPLDAMNQMSAVTNGDENVEGKIDLVALKS